MSKPRRSVRKSVFILVVVLLWIPFFEVVLRTYHFFSPSVVFMENHYQRFRAEPGSVIYGKRVNSLGFFDDEFDVKRRNDVYRIAAIGDSFVFGVVPFQYNFLTRIEDKLRDRGREVEVYNMGVVGGGPIEYFELLRREAVRLQPDMVLVSIYVNNDLTEALSFEEIHERERKPIDGLFTYKLYAFLAAIMRGLEGFDATTGDGYCDSCPILTEEWFMELEKERFLLNYLQNDEIHRCADRLYYHMMQMKELCDRESIRLVAIVCPAEVQISDGLRKKVEGSLDGGIGSEEYDMTLPNRLISDVLAKLEIPYIDLYEDFKREGKNRPLYRQRDTHWNIAGNELAASEICRFLVHIF